MADGKKRRNAGKSLPLIAVANSMKQKTLFDSFPLKNPTKIAAGQLSESHDLTHSATTAGQPRNASSLSNVIDLTKARTKSPSPFVEAIEDNRVETAREKKENTKGAHIVPSIIVVDKDDAGVSAAAGSLKFGDTSQPSVACEGKSPDQPIIIPGSPLKALPTSSSFLEKIDRPAHPFFSSKPRSSIRPLPSITSSLKHVAKAAPFPDRLSQHVKAFQTPFQTASFSIFPRREQRVSEQSLKDSASYAFLKQKDKCHSPPATLLSHFPIVQSRPPELNHVPNEHEPNHPAVTRFINKTPENLQSRRPWSEKWRPLCAHEVLGNEKSAIYLRDWLRALELQLEDRRTTIPPEAKDAVPKGTAKASNKGIKRPRVVRAVEKRRGRKKLRHDSDDEDDWIVYTDEESDYDVSTHSEIEIYENLISEVPPSLECSQNSDIQSLAVGNVGQDLGQLHNTILLTGPHGSGKTAAVYACAEELDWDVFEVYPGMGKRNGASLENYIGEVGKNHLVHQAHRNSGDFLRSLFRQREEIDVINASPSGDGVDTVIQDQNEKPVKSIRQSLILLEEVDILFKEDSNFWNTVTGIIKECKRPVICTCNDLSLVPVQDLPLQAVLEFKPCDTDVAVSYLRNLCSAEGYFVDSDFLSHLYTGSAVSSEALQGAPDLRRTINALQVICLPTKEVTYNELPLAVAKTSLHGIEFLSYMDSYLEQDPSRVFMIEELTSYVPSNDDEIGHCILYDSDAKDTGQGVRQEEISLFSRQVSGVDGMREEERKGDRELRKAVQEVCPLWVSSRRDGSIYMDYIPLIRQIVEADDVQEEVEMNRRGGGRVTRNSARAHGYVRTVMLTGEGRAGLIWKSYVM